jgi:hypothetical protein
MDVMRKPSFVLWLWCALAVALTSACGDNNVLGSAKALTSFAFNTAENPGLSTDAKATVTGTSVAVTVPSGTDVTKLVATYETTGATVTINGTVQTSGVTANNFSAPVAFTVTAADGSSTVYTVTVTTAASSAKELTTFGFLVAHNTALAMDVEATINGTAIAATVPYGTNVTALRATFTTTGASVTVAGASQASGDTANDFTAPVAYTVTAADGSTKVFTVTVTIALNSAHELTSFKFTSALNSAAGITSDVTATINGTAISATVPYGTNVTALVATFATTGASVAVGATAQASGTTANDFTSPVSYVVTAANATTKTYTVTVTAALNTAKELTAFKFTSALNGGAGLTSDVSATINGTAIALTVPYGTDVTALVATFTSTGASVAVGATTQVSGTTANNFSSPVVYRVTAADATTKDFTVTVTVAANPAKALTAFTFTSALNSGAGISSDVTGTIDQAQHTIAVTLPYGATKSNLIATFSTTGASVAIGPTSQSSGITANDFTNPVTYTVTAADGTTQDYLVTVTVALSPAKDITAFSFKTVNNAGLGHDTTATITGTAIAVGVAAGTNVTALVATFTTTGASVLVGATAQTSDMTANDFTNPVAYTVVAADGTTKTYTVTFTFYPASHCATNSQWTPVTCTTTRWDWSTDRTIATTVSAASTNHVLAVGTGDGAMCSLSGAGWVSTATFPVSNCNAKWYHIGGSYTGNCGGWDSTPVRHLADAADDCYAY